MCELLLPLPDVCRSATLTVDGNRRAGGNSLGNKMTMLQTLAVVQTLWPLPWRRRQPCETKAH